MKNNFIIYLFLLIFFTACQPSYPTISDNELKEFIKQDQIGQIVVENQRIAFIHLKGGRSPYDYQIKIHSFNDFYQKVEHYYTAAGSRITYHSFHLDIKGFA